MHKILISDKEPAKRLIGYHNNQMVVFERFMEQQRAKAKTIEMLQKTEPNWNIIKKLAQAADRPKFLVYLSQH